MKEFSISVRKVTDENLARQACQMTINGVSHQNLRNIYRSEHSPARTQFFWIECKNIPLYISTHLIRHHVGSTPYQLTCRNDRNGGNPGLIKKVEELSYELHGIKDLTGRNANENTIDNAIDHVIEELAWIAENTDRYTPVNLGLMVNAQSLLDMAKLRICNQASPETRLVFDAIKHEIAKIDPELAKFMVRKCVYRNGLCGEDKCCGFNSTTKFKEELNSYLENFTSKQIGATL